MLSRKSPWFHFGSSILLWVTLMVSPTFAQRELKDIPDPDPEIERKSFIVADGFEVNLFAADPLLHKPIQMNFDPQGRLWVAASEVYPQIAPGQKANDKILVLEDTDGDGKADESRVVLSGFGTEDTHHILHTLRWGPDGMLYMNQSVYIHSHIETPHGVRRLNAGGHLAVPPGDDEASEKCLLAGSSIRGVMRSTMTACRSRPTEPAARGSTMSSPARAASPRSEPNEF